MHTYHLNRRQFVRLSTAGAVGGWLGLNRAFGADASFEAWDPTRPILSTARSLKVQPLFMYQLPARKEEASWRSWGGVQTEAAAIEERQRITTELETLAKGAEFSLEVLPVISVRSVEEAAKVRRADTDVVLVYACTGSGELLKACLAGSDNPLIFVRHRSGPVYYWYEALSVKYLSAAEVPSTARVHGAHVRDVVVDDYQELGWRLRSLSALKNLAGTRVVALGGSWGKYSSDAPQVARDKYGLEVIEVSYETLAGRIQKARADASLMSLAGKWTDQYLALPGTTLKTKPEFLVNAFVLYRLFKEMMLEHQATVFTIKSCMGTVIPMSKTTACLSLSLLNDEGRMAFCESDFVVIPAGILLRYLSGKPVFLHNSTFPHQGLVTCAHCTGPRRMDGVKYEPTQILTHYESDYGAAPKVEMPIGQQVTFIDPEYTVGRWVGFTGVVKANPSYDICRSQQDVEIQGAWQKLVREARDSHWLMVYGHYLKEARYAAGKLGLVWDDLGET